MIPSSSLPREHVESFRDELLPPCWLLRPPPLENEEIRMTAREGLWETDSAGQLLGKIVAMIREAGDVVCLASFLFAEPEIMRALLEAAGRGVRVYVLTASEQILQAEQKEGGELDQERLEEHKQTLNALAGRVLVRTAEGLHAKFLLVDPRGQEPRGLLSTANFTTKALRQSRELAVELSAGQCRELFRQFLIGFWTESHRELLEPDRLRAAKSSPFPELPPPSTIPCTAADARTLRQALLSLLDEARTEVFLSTFGIGADHEVTLRILRLAKDGIKVRVLTRPRPSRHHMEALRTLARAGIEVRAHPGLHAKALWVDSEGGGRGLIMTANVDRLGLDEGFETGILLSSQQAEVLHDKLREWWDVFPNELAEGRRRGDILGDVLVWQDGRFQKRSIRERFETDLGEVVAPSAEAMETAAPPKFPRPPSDTLFHEHHFAWRIVPPP